MTSDKEKSFALFGYILRGHNFEDETNRWIFSIVRDVFSNHCFKGSAIEDPKNLFKYGFKYVWVYGPSIVGSYHL